MDAIQPFPELYYLPEELLMKTLTECEAPELLALRNASMFLRATIDNNLDYIIPRIIRRYYEEEENFFSLVQNDPYYNDIMLKFAVFAIMEWDLLDDGELDIGVLQRRLLPPSARQWLGDSISKFPSIPNLLPLSFRFLPTHSDTTMQDTIKVGASSYRRAASRPQHVIAWQQNYQSISNRGSLAYISFLTRFQTRVDNVLEMALSYGRRRAPAVFQGPEIIRKTRKAVLCSFVFEMWDYQFFIPELNILPTLNFRDAHEMVDRDQEGLGEDRLTGRILRISQSWEDALRHELEEQGGEDAYGLVTHPSRTARYGLAERRSSVDAGRGVLDRKN